MLQGIIPDPPLKKEYGNVFFINSLTFLFEKKGNMVVLDAENV